LEISRGGLIQQFLQSTPVVQPTLDLGNQFLGHVQGKAASFLTTIKDITGMLLSRKTGRAIRTDTGTAAKAERAEGGGP
jgi:hypothetical protein